MKTTIKCVEHQAPGQPRDPHRLYALTQKGPRPDVCRGLSFHGQSHRQDCSFPLAPPTLDSNV
ncbi:hypothetical protein ml_275 [Mollivirus sibericum]|uniref:hypothetical protein n=1 Tax=Mollivirus sibericum TaxID=1678078 RepID=UPI0006B2DCE2|nr:hypothetical protein ml_275 [Mollivirus sibericum]ALD62077.1 hypothetical protein ml_275 [Mollivirus sibericum]